jgi:4'-phosphopantetheinyl transferase
LTSDVIELWLVDLEKSAEPLASLERAVPRLSADDLSRAESIADVRDRRHRLAAYTALRILLERVAGLDVRCAPFVRTGSGKPHLASGSPQFSLSHIDGLALVGISRLPIGVDLERFRTTRMAPNRVADIMAIGSVLGDCALPPDNPDRAFIQAWARLEAFCKARGRGLSQTLSDVGVRSRSQPLLPPDEVEARARKLASAEDIEVVDFNPNPDVHGAVATARGALLAPVRFFPIDLADVERLALERT